MKKLVLLLSILMFCGCELNNPGEDDTVVIQKPEPVIPEPEPEPESTDIEPPAALEMEERKWTIMIYMSADNNLESYAIEDLVEMERSALNTEATTVLILLDRNPAYDTTNDNWYGTKLLRLQTGRSAESKCFISEEIDCKDLGLTAGIDTELDMSSDYTLSNFISFSRQRYPAEHYGLIIWGHGTGWRSEIDEEISELGVYKGFAYDETSKTYMTLQQTGIALKNGLMGTKLDFLGFDTCFGGEIEVAYELKNYGDYFIGTEGLLMSNGWNYETLFNSFQNEGSGTAVAFCSAVMEQFEKQYAYSNRASISVLRMDKVQQLFDAFDSFCGKVSAQITTSTLRDEILNVLYSDLNCKTESYSYGTTGNDIYLDVYSMCSNLNDYFHSKDPDGSLYPEVFTAYNLFAEADTATYESSWAADRSRGGLGVYFSTLREGNLLSVTYPAGYVKNKITEQLSFVQDSQGYVPDEVSGISLLNQLFYKSYN